jgi:hypothetical protein
MGEEMGEVKEMKDGKGGEKMRGWKKGTKSKESIDKTEK